MQSVEEFKLEFEKVYYNKILKILFPFEEKRKTLLVWYIWGHIAAALLAWFSFWMFNTEKMLMPNLHEDLAECIAIIPLGIGLVVWAVVAQKAKDFENDIKKQVMPLFLKSLPGFKWQGLCVISDGFVRKSELIGPFNSREIDDNFQGIYKDVSINICETELGEVRGSGKNRTYTVLFKGVLVSLFPDKNYKGTTLIKKGGILCAKPANLKEVYLEDPEFEKEFNVYSDDQIEARFVLTPSFIERFKNLKFAFKASKIEASIKKNGILIGLSINKDMFKVGKLHKPVADYNQFKTMIDEFASILELIDELKLNENIGL